MVLPPPDLSFCLPAPEVPPDDPALYDATVLGYWARVAAAGEDCRSKVAALKRWRATVE